MAIRAHLILDLRGRDLLGTDPAGVIVPVPRVEIRDPENRKRSLVDQGTDA